MGIFASKKISWCERLGLLPVIGSYRNVSTEALCVLTGVPALYTDLQCRMKTFEVLKDSSAIIINNFEVSCHKIMSKLYMYT